MHPRVGIRWRAKENPPPRQVVWLVMDELDTAQLKASINSLNGYSHLATASYNFTQAYPPANATVLSLPSYWLGKIPKFSQNDFNGVLISDKSAGGVSADWAKQDTIFLRRKNAGDSVFVRGWALNYCKTFSGNYSIACKDHSSYDLPGKDISLFSWMFDKSYLTKSILMNAKNLGSIGPVMKYLVYKNRGSFWFHHEEIIADGFHDIQSQIISGTSFIFWHMNCPHGPAFSGDDFIPGSTTLANSTSVHQANLIFCDKYLAKVMAELDKVPNDYMLIVVSDHWFRQKENFTVAKVRPIPLFIAFSRRYGASPSIVNKRFNAVHLDKFVEAYMKDGRQGFIDVLNNFDNSWNDPTTLVYDDNFEVIHK